jgi:acylglycerol lipase
MDSDFLGQTDMEDYIINKTFIDGEGTHLRLYHTRLTPKTEPIATIVIIHGFGEHSGRFRHIAENFVAQKYEVLLADMRGFGPRGCS